MTRAAVLGAGSWGTAFASVLADAGTDVALWARRPELAAQVQAERCNTGYLPGVVLPERVTVTGQSGEALDGADLVVLAVPSQRLRETLGPLVPDVPPQAVLVSLMKGIEIGTHRRMSQVLTEVAGVPIERVAVVTGPNLAREIAAGQPSATVVACTDEERARQVQAACSTASFRPYTNTDVVGCELGGAVKNVIALATGMAQGMGFGDNTTASLITRGLAETARLGAALGADPRTFAGLAGLGDLVATCSSPLSRNRTVGERIGRGEPVERAVAGQTAEGVTSCRSIIELAAEHGVAMPIAEHVAQVVHAGLAPVDMVRALMTRQTRSE